MLLQQKSQAIMPKNGAKNGGVMTMP